MGQLAVRLTDSHTFRYLGSEATITLNGATFDQFDENDYTYMTGTPIGSGFYMLDISYLYYHNRSLTVDLSAGGVIVTGDSGSVVVTTISATKDIIEVEMIGYVFSGWVTDENGSLVGAAIDLMEIDYLHDPAVGSHQHESTDENGDFYFDWSEPEGVTDVVFKVASDGHFPVEIPLQITPGAYYILVIRLYSTANTLVIVGAGHGINTDNLDSTGNWTVDLNPFHMRTLMVVATAAPAPAGSSKKIGHDPAHYIEDEGTAWFAGELYGLLGNVCPNLFSTRNMSRTAGQMRDDVGNQTILEVSGQPDPADWRRTVLWHISQLFPGGGDFEYQQAQHRIHRNHADPEYSFGPDYAMGTTGFTHTKLVADYSTYLTQTHSTLQPVLIEFHTNAAGAQYTSLIYRTSRTGGTTTNKPNDERFAKTVALNTKETFEAQPAAGLPAGTPVVRGRNTQVHDSGAASNVYEALCPTLVIESAFHDNLSDLTRAVSEYFQRNIALGVFRGIRDYYFPRLRGRLLDSSNTPQPNMVVYFTRPANQTIAPTSLYDIDSSTVTDGQGNFTINLERNTDYLLWIDVGGTYQALNPHLVNLTQNDPFINNTGPVIVPNPQNFTIP